METIQDYPSSYSYVTTQNQNVYYIPSVVLGKEYVKVIINGVTISSNVYDVINNSLILYFKPLDGLVLQVKVASSVKGITQLDFETSQEAVLDAMVKMNALIKDIDVIKSVRSNLTTITSVVNNMINITIVSSSSQVIKSISDNIGMFNSPDIKNHNSAINRNTPNSHTMGNITGLLDTINSIQLAGVFPTKIRNYIYPNDYVLAKKGGTVYQLKALAIQNKEFKLQSPVSPYVINNGILTGLEGVYKNNIDKSISMKNKNYTMLPNCLDVVEEDIFYPITLINTYPIAHLVNSSTNFRGYSSFNFSNSTLKYLWYLYKESTRFKLRIVSTREEKIIYENYVPYINNTGLTNNTLLGNVLNDGEYDLSYSRVSFNYKTIRPYIYSVTEQKLLKVEFKITNQYPLGVLIYSLIPYKGFSTNTTYNNSNMVISGSTFYRVRTDASYIYNLNTDTEFYITPNIVYKGNSYGRTTRLHNSIDTYNYRYIPYYNTKKDEIIFMDVHKMMQGIYTQYEYVDTTILPYIRQNFGDIPSFDSFTLFDFDLKHKRFLAGIDNKPIVYKDDFNIYSNNSFTVGSYQNIWLLPRNKIGDIYIAGVDVSSNYLRLIKNNTLMTYSQFNQNYSIRNYVTRAVSTYSGSNYMLNIKLDNIREDDLHLIACNHYYPIL